MISINHIQGGFFNWSAQKMTKCQITCKSLQKSSKCQNFLRVWHFILGRTSQKKHPVYKSVIGNMTSSICIRYEIYPPIGMRGLWNSKALSSNEIFDCRLIHTQGESWDCSYSVRESWDCKSQPFQRQKYFNQVMFYLCFGARAS